MGKMELTSTHIKLPKNIDNQYNIDYYAKICSHSVYLIYPGKDLEPSIASKVSSPMLFVIKITRTKICRVDFVP